MYIFLRNPYFSFLSLGVILSEFDALQLHMLVIYEKVSTQITIYHDFTRRTLQLMIWRLKFTLKRSFKKLWGSCTLDIQKLKDFFHNYWVGSLRILVSTNFQCRRLVDHSWVGNIYFNKFVESHNSTITTYVMHEDGAYHSKILDSYSTFVYWWWIVCKLGRFDGNSLWEDLFLTLNLHMSHM